MRQLVRSVSGDTAFFYVSTTPWLRLEQEAEWVNINFERRDLDSPYKNHHPFESRNSRVTKSIYETEVRKMTSNFELLTRTFLYKFFFWVTNLTSWNIKLNFELLTRRFNFYFPTFELSKLKNKKIWLRVTNSKIKLLFFLLSSY